MQEGVHFIALHMTKQKIIVILSDFINCLQPTIKIVATFSEESAQQVHPLTMCSFVVCLEGYEDDYIKKLSNDYYIKKLSDDCNVVLPEG